MTGKGRDRCARREELPTAFPAGLFLTLREDPEAPRLSSFNPWASMPLQLSIAHEVCYPRKRAERPQVAGSWQSLGTKQ